MSEMLHFSTKVSKVLFPGRYKLPIIIFLVSIIFTFEIYPQRILNQVNDSHQDALLLLKENRYEDAKNLLKFSAREYAYPPSYYELAKLEYETNTVKSRSRARNYLQKAIWKDPENIEYRLLMAELMRYFNRSMAYDVYEEIVEIDPECVEAVFNMGRICEEEFYEFYRSVRQDETNIPLSLDEFAIDDLILAEEYFNKAIELDSLRTDSYLHLSYLYQEIDRPGLGIPLLKKIIQLEPENKNAHLFLGYLYYKTADFDSCQSSYSEAMELMSEQEREEFKVNTALQFFDEELIAENKVDSILEKFWNSKDPLYLTEYNERLLEHYSRVAYSNLKFSVEDQDVTGWNSDRGEILIRYGEPLKRVRFRPYINAGGRTALMLKTDLWIYKDKEFGFTDDYWTGDYRFSIPNYSGRHFSQYNYDTYTYTEYLRRTKPEDYEPVYKGPVFSLPYNIVQLKDIDNPASKLTQVYLNYAVDISGRFEFRNRYKLKHESGLFFFDLDVNRISEKRDQYTYLEKNRLLELDSKEKFWLNTLTISAYPDTGTIAFEVIRDNDDAVSSNHFNYRIKDFNHVDLTLSDIIFATNVSKSPDEPGSIRRRNIQIQPNPTNTFTEQNNLFIYYEIYNLKQEADNETNFKQTITITKLEDGNFVDDIFTSIFNLFNPGGSDDELTLETNYQSFEKNTQVYLQVDMSNYDPGEYRVSVSVEDDISGEEATEESIIYWRK